MSLISKSARVLANHNPRGTVRNDKNAEHVRAPVWIEQEIAIAAFLEHCLGRKIAVAVFIHNSVKREGIREFLQFNLSFDKNEEVLEQLPGLLREWRVAETVELEPIVTFVFCSQSRGSMELSTSFRAQKPRQCKNR